MSFGFINSSGSDFDNDDDMRDPTFQLEGRSGSESDEHDSDKDDQQVTGINKILFCDDFFKIVRKMDKTAYQKKKGGVVAVCQVCSKNIKGSLGVSSNFLSHLRKHHPNKNEEFKAKKQAIRRKSGFVECTFSRNLLNFICETASPLTIIESRSFKKLFPGKRIPSRRSLTRLLCENYEKEMHKLTKELEVVKYVCTTADVWSGGKKSFLGYTCHWLDSHTFARKSAALACRRFKGNHTSDRIADLICDINDSYKVPVGKIVYTITDNGSNFVKAFKEFGVSIGYMNEEYDSNEDSDEDRLSEVSGPEFEVVQPRLSKHFRCASHTLNLLATTDFMKIINSADDTKNIHKLCSNIWNKCSRPKSAEIIKAVLSSQLITPCVTRWNSLYDSVKNLLEHKAKLGEVCYKLGIPTFLPNEYIYLEEYLKIMQPIADAIDFLQGEKNMLFGYFIPTLISIKIKMRRVSTEQLQFLGDANVQMQSALITRFAKYFFVHPEAMDAVIAAVVIPSVKVRFLSTLLETAENCSEELVRKTLHQYGLKFANDQGHTEVQLSTSTPSFLEFGDNCNDQNLHENSGLMCVSREASAYLSDNGTDLGSLHQFPIIKNIFLKFNTPLPSSAPVERLFSFAGIVNQSRRQKLTDRNFEMLVLKKANKF